MSAGMGGISYLTIIPGNCRISNGSKITVQCIVRLSTAGAFVSKTKHELSGFIVQTYLNGNKKSLVAVCGVINRYLSQDKLFRQ